MTPPELDPEAKARIEAEESYRAEVRERLAQEKPQKVAGPKQGDSSNGIVAFLILAIIGVGYFFFKDPVMNALSSSPPKGVPTGMSIQAQDTPDNYGHDLFIILKDDGGHEIASAGQATVEIYSKDTVNLSAPLWSKTFDLGENSFTKGERGQGAFKTDAIFAKLGRVNNVDLGNNSTYILEVRAWFTPPGGATLSAKTNAYRN